jgi:F-type H+-transporting ATPase subunit alpha
MNMLQQKEHDVVPVEEQVVAIYAVTNGLVDEIEPDNIPDWEGQFREYMRNSHEELLNSVRESQKLSDEDEERLKDAINKFNESYEPQTQSIVDVSAGSEENEEEDEGSSENGSQEG